MALGELLWKQEVWAVVAGRLEENGEQGSSLWKMKQVAEVLGQVLVLGQVQGYRERYRARVVRG